MDKCPVQFCRGECPPLPDGVEVIRASGLVICGVCGLAYRDHPKYYYPTGMGHAVKDCEGNFLQL